MASSVTMLNLLPPGVDLPLIVVLAGAGLGGAVLLGVAFAAFLQRRSRAYLLIALALSALFARSVVAGLSMMNLLPGAHHHVLEHSLDVAMVAFVIGAIYYARTADRQVQRSGEG